MQGHLLTLGALLAGAIAEPVPGELDFFPLTCFYSSLSAKPASKQQDVVLHTANSLSSLPDFKAFSPINNHFLGLEGAT